MKELSYLEFQSIYLNLLLSPRYSHLKIPGDTIFAAKFLLTPICGVVWTNRFFCNIFIRKTNWPNKIAEGRQLLLHLHQRQIRGFDKLLSFAFLNQNQFVKIHFNFKVKALSLILVSMFCTLEVPSAG